MMALSLKEKQRNYKTRRDKGGPAKNSAVIKKYNTEGEEND